MVNIMRKTFTTFCLYIPSSPEDQLKTVKCMEIFIE